jgi:hypothetical protein
MKRAAETMNAEEFISATLAMSKREAALYVLDAELQENLRYLGTSAWKFKAEHIRAAAAGSEAGKLVAAQNAWKEFRTAPRQPALPPQMTINVITTATGAPDLNATLAARRRAMSDSDDD